MGEMIAHVAPSSGTAIAFHAFQGRNDLTMGSDVHRHYTRNEHSFRVVHQRISFFEKSMCITVSNFVPVRIQGEVKVAKF